MLKPATKLPVRTGQEAPVPAPAWPFVDDLRREIDRLFEDFSGRSWPRPFRGAAHAMETGFRAALAADLVEKDTAFELTAEVPGITAKDIDVSMKDGNIVIKGEKHAEKEEKSKGYHLQERQYGSFERSFPVPKGVDTSAIEARFADGVLTVTLPKTMEAQKPAKKIEVKAGR